MNEIKFKNWAAEDQAASLEVVGLALEAIHTGAWQPSAPHAAACGVSGCVIAAVARQQRMHPTASVSQLCSHLLFDFAAMAELRVALAREFVAETV